MTNATQLLPLAKAAAIPEGKRNSALLSMAGALRNQGVTIDAINQALNAINLIQCTPPLTAAEVKCIAESASRWEQGTAAQAGIVPEMFTMARLLKMSLPDPQWAIPTFLPVGVTLLAGKPKMGKSWLALALALAIAENRLTLGTLPVTQGDILSCAPFCNIVILVLSTTPHITILQILIPTVILLKAVDWPVELCHKTNITILHQFTGCRSTTL